MTKSVLGNRHTVDLVYLGSSTFPICLLFSISILLNEEYSYSQHFSKGTNRAAYFGEREH